MQSDVLKSAPVLLIAVLFWSGCASSTIQSRKQERAGVYSELAPEMRNLVDQGQIKVGMPMEAVYIAWGKPSQILTGESAAGKALIWLYHGTYLEEYRYWAYRDYSFHSQYYVSPSLEHDYYPRSYLQAEVIFENGLVKQWRTLPQPPGY
jgi:hypothetical protein